MSKKKSFDNNIGVKYQISNEKIDMKCDDFNNTKWYNDTQKPPTIQLLITLAIISLKI